jgi:hypothetical protein
MRTTGTVTISLPPELAVEVDRLKTRPVSIRQVRWQTVDYQKTEERPLQREEVRAFEFVYGSWNVRNRKLRDVSDPSCAEWVEFDAVSEVFPILDGFGHVDRMHVPDPPDGAPFEGFTLRLFDPSAATWSIWWSSTRAPGRLEPPVVGHFEGDHGVFDCEDVIGGHAVVVRFEWRADASSPRWCQSFSYDGGSTWKLNWEMTFTRRT